VNFFDYVLITIVGLSMVLSIWRGFVREIISLIGLILAFIAASQLSAHVGALFSSWIESKAISNIIGFVLIFVLVMFTIGLIGVLIRKLVDLAALTATDRTLGIFFGAARGMLLVGFGFLVFTSYSTTTSTWMSKSMITPYALQLSDLMGKTIPAGYPFSTQGTLDQLTTSKPEKIMQQAIKTVTNHITTEEQSALKSLLIDTLEEAKP